MGSNCIYFLLFNELHLRCIAGLCGGLLVGISHGEDIEQFVAFAEAQALEVWLGFFRGVEEAHGASKAAGAESQSLCREHHVLAQQTGLRR